MMTLRNSLFISIFIHFLIFGSTLAFAWYYEGALLPRLGAVQVSLIPSSSFEEGSGTARNSEREPEVRKNVVVEQYQSAQPSVERNEQSVTQQANSTAVDASQPQSGPDAGNAVGARSGLLATEYLGLFEAIEKVKKYPRLARERGMEGVVRIRFKLDPSGGVETIKVVKSSGHEILDSASINAVYRAAPMPYVNGWVDIPMKYVLK
jgi:TonB family protein